MEKINCLDCTIHFLQKILTGAIFLLAPAANMLGTSRFFNGCMKWQHAVNLQSIYQINSIIIFSSLTDWTLYSFSELLSSSLLPFMLTNYSMSNSPSPFYSPGQNNSMSNPSSVFPCEKIILSQNSLFILLFID